MTMYADDEAAADAELVARCLRGDAAGWQALVMRYQRLVYAVACRTGLDEHAAADVFQTVFTRLLQALPTLAQPDRLRAWIVTTAKRESLVQWRRARRDLPLVAAADAAPGDIVIDELPGDSPLPEAELDELQQLHLLRLALDRLDERCAGLLALLFTDDDQRVPYERIAGELGMPVGSIGPTRARCLARLRALLLAQQEGTP